MFFLSLHLVQLETFTTWIVWTLHTHWLSTYAIGIILLGNLTVELSKYVMQVYFRVEDQYLIEVTSVGMPSSLVKYWVTMSKDLERMNVLICFVLKPILFIGQRWSKKQSLPWSLSLILFNVRANREGEGIQ